MAAYMAWVAKKHLLWFAVSLTFFIVTSISFAAVLSNQGASEITIEQSIITCMNEETEVTETFTATLCPQAWISLGESAITESDESATAMARVHPILELRFQAARAAAASQGVQLYISSGFRSIERQEYLFAEAVRQRGSETEAAKWVLPGKYSHHPQGLALDINYPNDPIGAQWLDQNGYRFGLCRVYQNEWWHFEAATPPGTPCPALALNALVDLP